MFNPQEPPVIHDYNRERTFIFLSRFSYSINKRDNKQYYFTGHDPQVFIYYLFNVRAIVGTIITKKRTVSNNVMIDMITSIPRKYFFFPWPKNKKKHACF